MSKLDTAGRGEGRRNEMTKAKRFNLTELLKQRSVEQPEEGEGLDT